MGGVTLTPRIRVSTTPAACVLSADPAGVSSAATQTVTLSRGGVVVYRATVSSSAVASVAFDATGSCPTRRLVFVRAQGARDPPRRELLARCW